MVAQLFGGRLAQPPARSTPAGLPRAIIYVVVLWLGALVVWSTVLAASYEPAKAQALYSSRGHDQSYIVMAVKGALLPQTYRI